MSNRRALFATIALLFLVDGPRASAQEAAQPRAQLGQASARPDEAVSVTGVGWQPGTVVVVELCGNEALDGAADCAPASAQNIGVRSDGTFTTLLVPTAPPTPCPCVVQVTSTSEVTEVRVPLELEGLPVSPPMARTLPVDIQRRLQVHRAELVGSGWRGWFGLSFEKTLVLEVENVGDVILRGVPLTLAVGRGDEPTGYAQAPDIGDLDPGERRVLRIPITFDSFGFGDLSVIGSVNGLGEPVRFTARTSNPPVAPIAVAVLALQLVLLRIRNRFRRRVARSSPGSPGPETEPPKTPVQDPAGVAPDDSAEVIDLDAEGERDGSAPARSSGSEDQEPVSQREAGAHHTTNGGGVGAVLAFVAAAPPHAAVERRLEAEQRLAEADAETTALVAAARERVAALEATREERLAEADARHESELELLDAVWQRAKHLAAASEASLAARRNEIKAELDEAGRAVDAAEAARAERLTAAQAELDEAAEAEAGRPPATADAPGADPQNRPRAPRIGDIDQRMARAVERALASMGHDSAN